MFNITIEDTSKQQNEYSITLYDEGIFYYILYGFADTHKHVTITLAHEGVEAHILGILIGSRGEYKLSTVQHHTHPNTTSDLHIKTVLTGNAKFHYDGVINIDKKAQKSNAYQKNDNLILSPDAFVNTSPELEIIANDVRCTHGATVGRLDEEILFYLQSRGVSRNDAQTLALQGFAEEILNKIPDDNAKKEIRGYLDTALKTSSIL